MSKRSMVRGMVLACLAVVTVPAAAKDSAKEHAFTLDKTVTFPKSERAELNAKVGPLTFNEVIIRNPPKPSDIKEAETKNPTDNCHPKLQVGVSNPGKDKMKFRVTVSFEDDAGKVYMKCDREDSVDAGADNDHTNMCMLFDSMKTIDWPKLTKVHVHADIDKDD